MPRRRCGRYCKRDPDRAGRLIGQFSRVRDAAESPTDARARDEPPVIRDLVGDELPRDARVAPDRHRLARRGQQQRFVRIGERHPAIADRAVGALDGHRPPHSAAPLLARHRELEHAAQALVHAQHVAALRIGPDPAPRVSRQIDADAGARPTRWSALRRAAAGTRGRPPPGPPRDHAPTR